MMTSAQKSRKLNDTIKKEFRGTRMLSLESLYVSSKEIGSLELPLKAVNKRGIHKSNIDVEKLQGRVNPKLFREK
jgi:hypothetical protein